MNNAIKVPSECGCDTPAPALLTPNYDHALPWYQPPKALFIKSVTFYNAGFFTNNHGGARVEFSDEKFSPLELTKEQVAKNRPMETGVALFYCDGTIVFMEQSAYCKLNCMT